jgi:site-specific recombinase XerD
MASLDKTDSGIYVLRWQDNSRRPKKVAESLKTSSHADAIRLKSELEFKYYRGEHDPWKAKWYEKSKHSLGGSLLSVLDAYLRDKATDRSASGWSDMSRSRVGARLKMYMNKFGPMRSIESLSAQEVQRMVESAKLAPVTKASDITKLRAFFNWAVANGHLSAPLKLRSVRVQASIPQYLTTEQIRMAVEQFKLDMERQPYHQYRTEEQLTRLWVVDAIWFTARTGLRITELMSLRVSDIQDRRLVVGSNFRTKSGKQRVVPLMFEAEEIARRYTDPKFRSRDPYMAGSDRLFGRTPGDVKARMNRWFRDAVKTSLGIHRTWHDLRHSFAYWYLTAESEKNTQYRLVALKELLGHASIDTTMIYSKLSPDDLRL